ncbi:MULTISPECIES: hypothetical protein [unclassified Pseudodesulfovibrio]|uniref:dienelactone hydrolase family protein n=1 Tax=unclassified Pseudodesulfovibrio TaxID=2661612 RepID=UPI000FEB91FE|nr:MULTISPECIES: hypothetical protein [unclassified Pseudodesulfovibrio]MCJ2165197.1 hypothetical protein [Pseudodesulfovibrio sp. S3-i]RWU03255.1 hypothetical protein DWB63_11650 [Pseudodesulfovibrio sp. S3]
MRKALSWFLSILFHAVLVYGLMQSIDLEPFSLEKLMEVDLAEVQEPEIITPMPAPLPVPPPEPVADQAETEELPAAAPLPMDKTVVLDDSPPPPAPAPEPEPVPEPEPEPDVVEISPVKTLPPEVELAEDGKPKKIIVRKDFTVHRGAEARFGRALMGDYFSYSSKEFSGQFKTRDNRTISIIDARNTKYGRFLIYDSKNKTLRRLKQAFGKYVYTIGPSLYADEPVTGSITFLAKNDRIERFILLTDDDRIAHYPIKVHVREEEVSFKGPAGNIQANLSRPPYDEGHAGVVVIHGPDCVDPGLVQGFTRTLSMQNLATLTFTPRGCNDEEQAPGTTDELVQDTLAGLEYLTNHPHIDAGQVGIWGNGPGVSAAIEVAVQAHPKYLICLLTDSMDVKDVPGRNVLTALDIPVLWLITGRNITRWAPLVRDLEALRDKNKQPFSIIKAPLKASQEVLNAQGDQSGWVEQVTDDHASVALSWIQTLK